MEEHELPVLRILTDRGTEYCRKLESHDYQFFLAINDFDHTKTKVKQPPTNGICERFHKTILQEFYQVAFRKKIYTSIEQLQIDLDEWLDHYNNTRTHQGKMYYGRTPFETMIDGKAISQKNSWSEFNLTDASTKPIAVRSSRNHYSKRQARNLPTWSRYLICVFRYNVLRNFLECTVEIFRRVRSEDLHTLYTISLATGHEGGDASHLYNDPQLVGYIYSAPYAVLEPNLAIVVEDHHGVAGFAVGAQDTEEWERLLEAQWWPTLRRQYANPPLRAQGSWTPDERRASMIHHPMLTPQGVIREYPAHLHLNLLPRLQGRGVGTRLFKEWRNAAVEQGAKGIHVGVNRANSSALLFWKKLGFVELSMEADDNARTVWMGKGYPCDCRRDMIETNLF